MGLPGFPCVSTDNIDTSHPYTVVYMVCYTSCIYYWFLHQGNPSEGKVRSVFPSICTSGPLFLFLFFLHASCVSRFHTALWRGLPQSLTSQWQHFKGCFRHLLVRLDTGLSQLPDKTQSILVWLKHNAKGISPVNLWHAQHALCLICCHILNSLEFR